MAEEAGEGRRSRGRKIFLSSAPLPVFTIPFIVKPDYHMRADLVKMPTQVYEQWHEQHFVFDEQYVQYVARKLEQLELAHDFSHVYAKDFDEAALIQCAKIIFKKLAAEFPQYVSIDGHFISLHLLGLRLNLENSDVAFIGGRVRGEQPFAPTRNELSLRVYDYLEKQNGLQRIWDVLALAVQEDLVIMRDDGEMGVSELMHVCFPSHWNPGKRVGQSLYALHEPVANNEQLLKASKNTLQAMVNKGPFVRFVWSLNSTDELNLNPTFHTLGCKKPLGDDPSQWFFRVERQTTLPMPELKRSLFTIRIFVAPLPSVLSNERRKRLEQAVLSMDEKLLSYKGLITKKGVLLEYLNQ